MHTCAINGKAHILYIWLCCYIASFCPPGEISLLSHCRKRFINVSFSYTTQLSKAQIMSCLWMANNIAYFNVAMFWCYFLKFLATAKYLDMYTGFTKSCKLTSVSHKIYCFVPGILLHNTVLLTKYICFLHNGRILHLDSCAVEKDRYKGMPFPIKNMLAVEEWKICDKWSP